MAPIQNECDYLMLGIGSGGIASARRAVTHGAQGHASFDWSYFKSKRDVYVKRLNRIYANNLGNDEIEHIQGRASFLNKREVEVKLEDGSKQTIKAKKILIATGGRPTIPAIPGKELFIDSDGFHDLERQLKKVAVSGVEMSEMLHALGSDVRFFIRGEKLLRRFDPMIQDTVMKEDERQGVHLHKGSQTKKPLSRLTAYFLAVGRLPEVEDLALEKVGIKLNGKGHIIIDNYQNTNVENIYAIGDVCDRGFELTPMTIAASRRLSERLFGEAHEKYGNTVKVCKTEFTAAYYAMMEQGEKGPTAYKIVCEGTTE
ncbi:FAD/NAD(P)-binding domain-containing protein [Lepidopterella palustris CBS 459.81]|uniref:FAD/NAD(P)-binding domain-containing protein n=1 Tax=Lepidopterella palustris CBS 459.81 TaxID=1314670 RepID=A0A8E2JKG9_9PEZI|nr:FAD/NAD(P)-binding domain-containing protein [Lepidopterella palustris CBS 459.81]